MCVCVCGGPSPSHHDLVVEVMSRSGRRRRAGRGGNTRSRCTGASLLADASTRGPRTDHADAPRPLDAARPGWWWGPSRLAVRDNILLNDNVVNVDARGRRVRGSCASVGRSHSSSPAGGTTAAAGRRRGSSLDAVVVPLAGRYSVPRVVAATQVFLRGAQQSWPRLTLAAALLPLPARLWPPQPHKAPGVSSRSLVRRCGRDGRSRPQGRVRGGNSRRDDTACSCPHKGPPPEHTTLSM
jgi:hypothetical protein